MFLSVFLTFQGQVCVAIAFWDGERRPGDYTLKIIQWSKVKSKDRSWFYIQSTPSRWIDGVSKRGNDPSRLKVGVSLNISGDRKRVEPASVMSSPRLLGTL